MTTIRSISDVLADLQGNLYGENTAVSQIIEAFHERGFGFVLLFFAVPMALPLPVPPGINILLATPLLLLTAQQALGRHTVWLPQKIMRRAMKTETLSTMIGGVLPWARRVEILLKPRMGYITRGVFSNIIGVMGFIMALSVCVPIPLTNTIPSLGIALMAAGVIMRDGLAVLAGAALGMAWVVMLVLVTIFLGTEGIDVVKNVIKSWL